MVPAGSTRSAQKSATPRRGLTARAEMRAALPDDDMPDRCSAAPAGLPGPVVHGQIAAIPASGPARCPVVGGRGSQRGAAVPDTLAQNVTDSLKKALELHIR